MGTRRWCLGFLMLVISAFGVRAGAQAGASGSVSGRVVFADTNGPARFSKVLLKSLAGPTGDDAFSELLKGEDGDESGTARSTKTIGPKRTPEQEAERRQQVQASASVLSAFADLLAATTVGGDGQYYFANVKPGTYYVHAVAKGYVDPLAQFTEADLQSKDPAMRKRIAAVATVILVTGNNGAHADLRLERGASISGRVLYDDGTPAAGWTVRTVRGAPGEPGGMFSTMGLDASDMDVAHMQEASITDDAGSYRVAGLATGDYILQARLTTGSIGRATETPAGGDDAATGMMALLGLRLTVYSGNTVKRSEAKPVSVQQGESRSDYDLTLPLRSMHALGGTVRARTDGHAVSAGSVQLSGQTPDGKEDPGMHLVAVVRGDGSFRFDYVPGPGTYTLKVVGAVDSVVSGESKQILGRTTTTRKTTKTYGSSVTTATLGESDVTDLKLDVPDLAKDQGRGN